ncbi:MAG: chromosome segregation protein SMC [Oscillospiraceae bacterium]|nr:chromosome segregation protein SMC [Oscillospiraceae bacterium]
MRLKSIEVQGFKSFADKTSLSFNDGITAVIGPNGSGKSNIADAIRWVLGEQSTKTLRGGKMEDVIFGGTQARKAQGVASVTLTIDNSDRSLAGFEGGEVSVTRRLYRSGESEYRINGAQVRLRDINELFMDTGLGRDGYSIIGQGRVAEIVSARSKERREIFEEAAGISKFRYRKTEAERRLALAEDNLLRLRDILSELDSRVGPLKVQSEKAQKFLELAGEKKQLEISVWMNNLKMLRDKAASIEDKLILAQNDFNEAESAANECERLFNEETEHGRELMVSIELQREEINKQTEIFAGYESQKAVLQNDISHHQRSIDEIKLQMAQAGVSREETAAVLDQVKAEIEKCRTELEEKQAESRKIADGIAALIQNQQQINEKLTDLRSRRAGAFEAIEAAKIDAASAGTMLGESAERIAAVEKAQADRQKAVEDSESELSECEKLLEEIADSLQSLNNSEKGYLLKQQGRAEKVRDFDNRIAELERKIAERRQKAKLLSDMDKNMEGFGQSIKFVMSQARAGAVKGIHGPVSSLIKVDNEFATAIETALGGAMQNIVVDNEDVAKRAISILKNSKSGRATFLPLISVKGNKLDLKGIDSMFGFVGLGCDLVSNDSRYDGIIDSLLGRVVVAEDLDSAVVIAKKHGYRFRIVTLDGQVVNAGGSMTGGYTAKSAGILGRQGEIERLQKDAEGLEKQLAELDGQRESVKRELAALNAEIDAIEAQKKSCTEDSIRCAAELNAAKNRLDEAVRQVKLAENERELLTQRIEEIKAKTSSSKELEQSLQNQLDSLQKEIAELTDQSAAITAKSGELLAAQNECASAIMLCQRDIAAGEQEVARLNDQLNAAENLSGEHQQKIDGLLSEIEEANRRIEEIASLIAGGKENAAAAQQKVLETMKAREDSERRCSELRIKEREEASRRDGLYREVVRLSEQKNAAETQRQNLINKLYDEYEMTQSDAEEQAQPLDDVAAAERRLSELRNKIRGLGSVNVGAIEEYKEVSERHGELTRQLADIESSKAELTKMINELTEEMKSIFTVKFEAINRNFGTTFKELFGGGSASLSLTDPDNVLESGIEITVHPPGKLIKNLAALSGGEQAFVAIAIFFSILKVNPSPFCLMDEIEAALDDVNVVRFAQYLHTLSEKTQFITITHRRGTMEEADVLYGVTMQEEGVSKLLELQVSEIEKGFGIK